MTIEVSFDATLKIAEVITLLGGGGVLAYRLGRASQRLEAAMEMQRTQITELQQEVKEVGKVLTVVALQDQRLDMLTSRVDRIDQRTSAMYRGDGGA